MSMPSDTGLVSIIVPTYNRGNILGETISSVIAQTYSHWELFVIDDGSTDNTETIVEKFGDYRIRYYKLAHTGSLPFIRNFGINKSTGYYIALLDSDDLWEATKLEYQLKLLSDFTDATFVLGNGKFFGSSVYREPQCEDRLVGNLFEPFLLQHRFPFFPSTLLFKKSVIDQLGLMDESFKAAAEIDFFLQLSNRYCGIFINEKLVRIRKHNQNISDTISFSYSSFDDSIKIAEKLYKRGALTKDQYRIVLGRYLYSMGVLGLKVNDTSKALHSFLSHAKIAPMNLRGWVRIVQCKLLQLVR